MTEEKKTWFPIRRNGMGWGFPCSWQGRVVFLLYAALIIAASWLVPPDEVPTRYVACTLGSTVLFIGICILKGGRRHCQSGK